MEAPPLTKAWMVVALGAAAAEQLGMVPAHMFMIHWQRVVQQLEVWRVLTCVLSLGPVGLSLLGRLALVFQHSSHVERAHGTDSLLWCLIVCSALLLPAHALPTVGRMLMQLGPCLASAVLFFWSRDSPGARTSLMGMLSVQAKFLPYLFAALSVLMSGSVLAAIPDVAGIIAAHTFRFFTLILPRLGYRNLLPKPAWVSQLAQMIPGVDSQHAGQGGAFGASNADAQRSPAGGTARPAGPGSTATPGAGGSRTGTAANYRPFSGTPRRLND